MRMTHAHSTLLQFCASSWAWSLVVWAAPLENLQLEHRGTVDVPLAPDVMIMPAEGSFMTTGEDGSYRFGFQSSDQWRVESRNAEGEVEGRYVYKTPDGQIVNISFNAGPQGFIAEGDAIPGGRAPLVDAPIAEEERPVLQLRKTAIEDVEIKPYGALSGSQPYGALRVSSLPGYTLYNGNVFEDLESQAIIVSAYSEPLPDVWPPQLTFKTVPRPRGDLNDVIYGPGLFNGQELEPGFIDVA